MKYKLTVQLQPFKQCSIEECIEYAIDLAKKYDVSTVFNYYRITVVAFPDSTTKRLLELYNEELNNIQSSNKNYPKLNRKK